jgi:DNA-binding MarR family transcriptional regulator
LTDSAAVRRAQAVRHFNRFYSQHIGALHEHLAKSAFSLTEARVLRELTLAPAQTASALGRTLGLDSGYLSRLLTGFERRELITRRPSDCDARQSLIALTVAGHAAYEPLDTAAVAEVLAVIGGLSALSQEQLIAAMKLIERLLGDAPKQGPVTLREPRAGEYGWLVHRQAQWFAAEHGWDQSFERWLARVVADCIERNDAVRERCWVAGRNGGGFGLPRRVIDDGGGGAHAVGRARLAAPGHRQAIARRMRAVRSARGLCEAYADDREHPHATAASL